MIKFLIKCIHHISQTKFVVFLHTKHYKKYLEIHYKILESLMQLPIYLVLFYSVFYNLTIFLMSADVYE